nr:unnamed protein product [Callosobruchus analis]
MDVREKIGFSQVAESLGQSSMNEQMVFKRSSLLQHSPPHRARAGSLPSIKGFAERQEARKSQPDTQPLPKRKREGSPITGQSATEESEEEALRNFIRKISDTAKDLKNLIKAIPNTKADIKNGILEINRQIEQLDRKGYSLKLPNRTTEQVGLGRKQTCSIGVQADIAPSVKGSTERDVEVSQIEKVLSEGGIRRKILHIMGADAVTTLEDVADAIKGSMKVGHEAFVVRSARQAYGETQNFTVEAEAGVAEGLLAAKTIRLGLLNCEVRERINLIRCFRCKNLGHVQSQCTGPDRRDNCLRCGGKGHIVKACPEGSKEYCFSCKEEGHRNDTMKCPAFRKLLFDQRRKSRLN